ncbi:prolyl 4-hydroxylase subunit alpha-3-like isoform X2 [Liolophura sinensis]
MQGFVRDRFIQPLSIDDALVLGAKAAEQHFFTQAIEWYDVPLRVPVEEEPMLANERIEATLGLINVYLQFNDFENALKFSRWAFETYSYDDRVRDVHADVQRNIDALRFGKMEMPPPANPAEFDEEYAALCRGEVDWTNQYISQGHCIVRTDSVPYRLVKQEILSFDPFISLFYDVLSETEGNKFRNAAKENLYRAMVGNPSEAITSEVRVGQLTWLDDSEPSIKKISARVMDITGLDVTMRTVQSSSESFQIVNYGIGGHYEPHTDTYSNRSVLADVPDFLQNTGDRLATFLFYLGDVVEGGSTVFPRVGIQVPVVKNGAAFWYNLNRAGENDERVTHAGCPVLLGQKWVANKWIREHGQEFRHGCGLTPTTPHHTS